MEECRGERATTLRLRFSLVAFAVPESTVFAVVGSLACLGNWNPQRGVPLHCCSSEQHASQRSRSIETGEPHFWSGVVTLAPEEQLVSFEYKFVRWTGSIALSSCSVKHAKTASEAQWNSVEVQRFLSRLSPEKQFDNTTLSSLSNATLTWEGRSGHTGNRVFLMFDRDDSMEQNKRNYFPHIYNPEINCTADGIYTLPVEEFQGAESDTSEYSHTARFYRKVKETGEISYNKIMDRLYFGSCPRTPLHVDILHDQDAISDVVNLQTAEDIVENFPDPSGVPNKSERVPSRVRELYASRGMRFIWIPIADMNSDARALSLAQTAFVVAGLLFNPQCTGVYVHCNAGVGRSSACVAAYLTCFLHVPIRLAQLILNCRRPVTFFDEPALLYAQNDYLGKFEAASAALKSNLSPKNIERNIINR